MDIKLSEDERELQRGARDFLAHACPVQLVRELQDADSDGHSPALWTRLAEDGWLGMGVPEKWGGGGASLFDLGLFYEETGRVLLPTPFYSTMHAAILIELLGTGDQRAAYARSIAQGSTISAVAFAEPQATNDPRFFITEGRMARSKWIISGQKAFVPNAALAEPLVVIARTSEDASTPGLTAFLVPRGGSGVRIERHRTFGKDFQGIAHLESVCLDVDAVLGGSAGIDNAGAAVSKAAEMATALQCMEMVGGAQRVLELTVAFVANRRQFKVPIGSFQAVQHHLANVSIKIESARLAAMQALWLLSRSYSAVREVSVAKTCANDAYVFATLIAHQVHGGMGYVLETDLHLWSQRAKATQLTFGTSEFHYERIADAILL